jgi:hypothetical protein
MSIEFPPLPELRRMSIGSPPLESGESIDDCSSSWVEHGLADPDAPVALVLCAIGSTHQRMDRIVALSPLTPTPGWSAGINEAARRALHPLVAPGVWTGRNHLASAWEGWALIMQLLAVRALEQVASEILDHHALRHGLAGRVQEWAERRFDPLDWVYQSLAYDRHDVGKTPGMQGDAALANIQAKIPILGRAARSIQSGRLRGMGVQADSRLCLSRNQLGLGAPYLQCGRYRKCRAVAPVRLAVPLGFRK